MATQDITNDKIVTGNLRSLDEKQQLSDVVLNSVDDQVNDEFDPKEERAFVRFLTPLL